MYKKIFTHKWKVGDILQYYKVNRFIIITALNDGHNWYGYKFLDDMSHHYHNSWDYKKTMVNLKKLGDKSNLEQIKLLYL